MTYIRTHTGDRVRVNMVLITPVSTKFLTVISCRIMFWCCHPSENRMVSVRKLNFVHVVAF